MLAALAPTPAPLRSTITESTVLTGERDTRWSSSATTKASKPHTNYACCLGSFALSHATSTQRTRPDAPPRRNSSCRRRKVLPRARPVLVLLPAAHQLQATLAANLYTPPYRSTAQDKASAHAAPHSTSTSKPSTHPVPCHPAATAVTGAHPRTRRDLSESARKTTPRTLHPLHNSAPETRFCQLGAWPCYLRRSWGWLSQRTCSLPCRSLKNERTNPSRPQRWPSLAIKLAPRCSGRRCPMQPLTIGRFYLAVHVNSIPGAAACR